ncbi:hypothetical protein E5Q_00662 [Mixia osmundae IAM 14324]|uniref:Cation efflux protein n=1 Tax=Mixia osmundae (strain CBS 9802 / IAM 14324 / JCM 22182 / KY 12970) TaxID=764103 RepID=G7DTV5_MIXOS|nr:hypothetical protein E5Q_00662 [Mixia osmundae IAM 14324]
MAGRTTRIKILLAIDTVFLLVELITGYAVGSLALVADSFHMLNDVCSLIVALYAIKLAQRSAADIDSKYTYGWQRAEILGALINGVFLLALCFSIFMEAIERFFNATEVGSPKLVVIVGSLGLLSNVVGLFLFHEHGHGGHGGHTHSPSDQTETHANALDASNIAEEGRMTNRRSRAISISSSSRDEQDDIESEYDELFVHPAEARANVVRRAQGHRYGSSVSSQTGPSAGYGAINTPNKPKRSSISSKSLDEHSSERAPFLPSRTKSNGHAHGHDHDHSSPHVHENGGDADDEEDHGHQHGPKPAGSTGHSHGNMNMRGVFLHVLGDALGNVGVIVAGLVIWLSTWQYRFYFDPAISLLITCIIFASALPLVKSASFILLQGTPSTVPVDRVRDAIMEVQGVVSVHELHIWSLSESVLVASVHVLVPSKTDYVEISDRIRTVLHSYGIHSSTIQPEIIGEQRIRPTKPTVGQLATLSEVEAVDDSCYVQCVSADCADGSCCPPPQASKPDPA